MTPFLLRTGLVALLAAAAGTALAQTPPVAPWRRPAPYASEAERLAAFHARRDSVIDVLADQVAPTDLRAGGYWNVAADLVRGQDLAWCVARLDSMMKAPAGDMFWMYPFTTVQYAGRDRLPAATQRKMRDLWRTYMPYRGDTENHWAMYYASLYLAAQLDPESGPETWFNGKSARENMAEADDYLRSWVDLTTSRGQGEYDSPGYMSFYVAPMAMLYAWADDPALRTRAGMMLDYLLADFYAETLDGVHVGASSRIYPGPLLNRSLENASAHAWLLFGNTPFALRGEAFILAISGYEPSAILHGIATDRSAPYLERELKRTRHRIRVADTRNGPVYKETYVAPTYAVGSTQGGILQPLQQHTWEFAWRLADPRAGQNLVFALNPYSDPSEGAAYFAEPYENVTELIVRSKREYDSSDKFTGGSPFEQVVQTEDAVVALYSIPRGTRFPFVSGFFGGGLTARDVDTSGWIFGHGGEAYVAYYPLAPYEWKAEPAGAWRLHSPHLQNGAVVQAAPAAAYPSFDAFKAAIRALPLRATTSPRPSVQFTTLRGTAIDFTYGETPRLDGRPVDYAGWPLYDGPFLRADAGSSRLEMRHGRLRRTLDFATLTVTDTVESP